MTPGAPRAVLFDLDNTLVHRARGIAAWAARFGRDFGDRLQAVDVDAIAALAIEQDNGGYLPADAAHGSIQQAVAAILASHLPWAGSIDAQEIRRHWVEQLPGHSVEMPGAAAIVEWLARRGTRIAIVSNGAERTRAATVASLAFRDRIAATISSERAGAKKPDPAIFSFAAGALGVAPDDCWFVGDHPANDIAGAQRAGMAAVWLQGFHRWDLDAPPRRAIASLDELAGLIDAA